MFIRSQDKQSLVNEETVAEFYINEDAIIIASFISERHVCIATYATPERSQEVFGELCRVISEGNTKLFEMPEK